MESSEASGRPLASTIPQSSQGTTTQTPSLRKRRRESQSFDERVKSRRRPTSNKEDFGGGGSSRGGQSSPMQRSTSPTDSMQHDVRYTSTGRISKAKKGLKVHLCENCGRSYTRAEHLRRHEKNHNQDALVCNFPDCGKTFYRPDLLQRHQERHNETSKDESRRTSLYSQGSAPEADEPLIASAPAMPSSQIMDAVSRTHDNPSSFLPVSVSPMPEQTSDPRYKPAQFLTPQTPTSNLGTFLRPSTNVAKQQRAYGPNRPSSVAIAAGAQDALTGFNGIDFNNPWNGSPNYSSSSGYASPGPGHDYSNMFVGQPFGSSSNRTRTSSNASFIEAAPWSSYPSTRSPTSTTSTMPFPWSGTEKSPAHLGLALQMVTSSGAYAMSLPMSAPTDAGFLMYPAQKTVAQRDDEEHQFLFSEQLLGMTDAYQFEQYLDNYWRLFHPSFPVVHQPTFSGVNESPLLRAAMIAIGAQYTDDSGAKAKSRLLHEKCMKLLDQRDMEVAQSLRLCDLQAIFLVEVMFQYRARRGARILTRRLEEMYRTLSQDPKVQTSTTVEALAARPPISNNQPTYDRWCQWIDLSCRQHLLLSCYILETQQTIILARPQQNSILPHLSGDALPFPTSIQLWEAPSALDWAIALHQQSQLPGYVYEVTSSEIVSIPALDIFQSSLLISTNYNHFHNPTPYLHPPSYPAIDHLLDTSPLTRHHLLSAQLLQHVPIRALLAVSGETWILSEKVGSMATFAGFKTTLRTWLNELWAPELDGQGVKPVKAALKVAVNILQHAMTAPAQTLCLEPGAEMGLYHAALVLWAVTLASHSRQHRAQNPRHPQHRSPSQSRRSSQGVVPQFQNPGYAPPMSFNIPQVPAQLQQQSMNPAHPSTTGLIPSGLTSQAHPSSANGMLQSDITFTSLTFLNIVSNELDTMGGISPWPRDLAQWQQGVGALLRWVKMRLRGVAIDGRDSVVSTGPTSGSMSRGSDGLGELLDGVVGMLEKIMSRGWEGWGI